MHTTHTNRKPAKKRGGLFAAALLIGTSLTSLAGDRKTNVPSVPEKMPDGNPLSFFDGKVVFDFEEKIRGEYRENNFDFNSSVDSLTDDAWLLQRVRIGLKLSLVEWFTIYVQAQDAREIGSDRPDFPGALGAEGDDAFDLRQAWIQFGNPKNHPLTFKIGRQVLSYGDERLIGAFEWNNIGRTFDALKLRWEEASWSLDAFASTVVVPVRGAYNQSDLANGNELDRKQVFSGLYLSTTAFGPQVTDLYVLHLHENTSARYQSNSPGDTSFFTLGLRVKSKPGAFAKAPPEEGLAKGARSGPHRPVGFDYDAEFAFQTGEVRGRDLAAFAAHAGAGYTFDTPWLPRVGIAYNYATGDGDPLDSEIETFQNLFPTNHKFYGQMDVFAWQNMHNIEASFKLQPHRSITFRVEFHAFWIASTDDVWFRANGVTAVRPLSSGARNAGSYAGSEIDLLVQWNVNKHFQMEAGYSRFFAGDYLAATGPSDDADFAYLQARLAF